ncbi:MAG: hypothetical protein WKF58_07665 [Ilumatobacteraceae bacterium]
MTCTETACTEVDLRRSDDAWLAKVIEVVRATRSHPSLRVGSSVRGALDIAAVVPSLAELRGAEPTDPALGLDAALIALTGRVRARRCHDTGGGDRRRPLVVRLRSQRRRAR